MSDWQRYVQSLVDSGHISRAAMCGVQDGGVWACSPGMNLTQQEVLSLTRGFNDPSILYNGFYVSGKKYRFIKASEDDIQGRAGKDGITIAKSNLCVIIGEYSSGMQPGSAALAVGKIMDYLKASNY